MAQYVCQSHAVAVNASNNMVFVTHNDFQVSCMMLLAPCLQGTSLRCGNVLVSGLCNVHANAACSALNLHCKH